MRGFSPNVMSMLSDETISIFYLIKMTMLNIPILHTTLPYDVNIPGLGVFSADNNLISVEAPKLSTVVDRAAYKLIYADPDLEFKSRFEVGVIGSPVSVYVGFFNTTDSEIGGAQPGAPLLTPEDILMLYSGIIDSNGYSISEDSEIIATFECSSPMADLNAKRVFVTTDDEMRKQNPLDKSFEFAHLTSSSVSIGWGKI